ncbi:peptidoglycan-binding protein [Glaciecola sp. 1036]|uniref:CIS tube protein n=1 Tax=Alteromonadaceae TaxID=72275 RepID=UPI003D058099
MKGELEKLKIQAFAEADYSGDKLSEFSAFVNPNELTLAYEMEYDSAQGSGTTNSRMDFKQIKPGDLNVTLFLDGTGASGEKIDVQTQIEAFQSTTGYNGDIHRPNYLIVAWGSLTVRRCILKSASIAYKLFKRSGEPLRAVISATFTDNSDDQTRVALAQDQSPDLTHSRVFKAGDSLPNLCHEIYGNAALYTQVAKLNALHQFRNISPGTRLLFPPLEK